MKLPVLVTGGAGYIGSHAVLQLRERGYSVVVVDNFSRGSRQIAEVLDVPIVEAPIDDESALSAVCAKHRPVALMHFAAFAYVGESVSDPASYYANNVGAAIRLLSFARRSGIRCAIFSSTCSTYGVPEAIPIDESCPQAPINPYGRSKLMVETVLSDFDRAYDFRSVTFRYFNAAGAHPSGCIGESHDPETHLIPLALAAASGGKPLNVFGTDYPTPDGSCIRDYIHVCDIAEAHVLGLDYLLRGGKSDAFNIGTGRGHSVFEVIQTVETVTGRKVPHISVPRRPGDPPILVAKADKIRAQLHWEPRFPELSSIVSSAWKWLERGSR